MKILKSDFTFSLPPELIAKEPVSPRDASRMLILNREKGTIEDGKFLDLPDILRENSLLIANNSKVIPARLEGNRATGGRLEALLVKEEALGLWSCKVKNAAKLKEGERVYFEEGAIQAIYQGRKADGHCLLAFTDPENLFSLLENHAHAPLPPYIQQERASDRKKDIEEYQTLFAKHYGAIAAPTAGLHFTEPVMTRLQDKNILWDEVTLHVGLGTFEPIRENDLALHQMHNEEFIISSETAQNISAAKKAHNPIVSIGTTSLRALESAACEGGVKVGKNDTEIFIYPPYDFQVVDQLLTNFHLPESTLMMLISAFGGKELIFEAYQKAIEMRYRFYSFGDCMLIL